MKSMGDHSSNELQRLDLNIGYQDNNPSHGHQSDMPYWEFFWLILHVHVLTWPPGPERSIQRPEVLQRRFLGRRRYSHCWCQLSPTNTTGSKWKKQQQDFRHFQLTCHKVPELDQNWPDASSIRPVVVWFWYIMACLQWCWNSTGCVEMGVWLIRTCIPLSQTLTHWSHLVVLLHLPLVS